RRGRAVRTEYAVDYLTQVLVRDVALKHVVTVHAAQTLREVRTWLQSGGAAASHQGFPVVDERGVLVGVVTRRDLLDAHYDESAAIRSIIRRPPAVVFDDNTLREAADHMVREGVGRL